MSKWEKFIYLLNTNPYSKKKEQRFNRLFCKCLFIIAFFSLPLIPVEILCHENKLVIPTICFFFIDSFIYILARKFKLIKLTQVLIIVAMSFVFSGTFLAGHGQGNSAIWMLLMPCLSMYLGGFKIGIITSLYFWLLEGSFCFIPFLRTLLPFLYSTTYLSIIFIVLSVDIIFSFLTMATYYQNQLKTKMLEEGLEKAVLEEHEKLTDISLKTILVISNAVEAKDEYTSQHSHRVADFSCMIARKLGWSEAQLAHLKNIALLHDIGKISVPESVLNKPGKLTDEEYEQIKRHTVVGGEILHDLTLIPHVALGAEFHHERYDSRGYPSGLSGTDIPFEARIICIADSFDAMRYKRVYRGECDSSYILAELNKGRGTQFDPELLDIFLEVIEEEHLLQIS